MTGKRRPDFICGCYHWRQNVDRNGNCALCHHPFTEKWGLCEVPQRFNGRRFVDQKAPEPVR